MFKLRTKSLAALLAAPVALCLASGIAHAQTFDEPLEKCSAVTSPAALTTCAGSQDPLQGGGAIINDQGDVTVTVFGAATNTMYSISFVSNDGTQTTSLGSLMTDKNGNGAIRKEAFFKFGTVGAGNVVLSNGGEQFVTGLNVSSTGIEYRRDFRPGLVRCTDVTVPGTLSSCGSDSLTSGFALVEQADGAVLIHVSGARPSTTYTASLVSPTGASTTIGTLPATGGAGDAMLTVSSPNAIFPNGIVGSGQIVLTSGSTNEFVSGFKVDQKFVAPKISGSTLEPCASVTYPAPLANCGSDPLDSGSYKVEAGGQVSVTLQGATPSTNYEAWFRPLDNSGDIDTMIGVPTDASGNAHTKPKVFFTKNTVAAGTIVIKEQANSSEDQFVAGYDTH
jgi:hypothetical protein